MFRSLIAVTSMSGSTNQKCIIHASFCAESQLSWVSQPALRHFDRCENIKLNIQPTSKRVSSCSASFWKLTIICLRWEKKQLDCWFFSECWQVINWLPLFFRWKLWEDLRWIINWNGILMHMTISHERNCNSQLSGYSRSLTQALIILEVYPLDSDTRQHPVYWYLAY